MKLLVLSKDERRTLREMGIFHSHPRTRMRAQGILRLSQGLTLQQTADEFMVHLSSVEQWRQRWNRLGLAGLYEGRRTDARRNGQSNRDKRYASWRSLTVEWQQPCCVTSGSAKRRYRLARAPSNAISRK
ncbi:helix-turn-helix domain-containing protein [Massilia pseudoviolaceinigra]|uniref:helix-turn-helix domain-containing protein n=1 Tax=Massilia pseudoviolaceinigra TaxID=3057165 RepID=UPI0035B4FB2E